ncbi:universal stress protein [Pseudoflavitalea rhizosphaerae]|uniref:universal stress protein n=1 Tax=Pseudoflavitalea rhizosphaerae TaxID=1884793 RepID=UPI000F8E079B|nr:universal stress protein [Pseudoflavitalea rhizosphaerae]
MKKILLVVDPVHLNQHTLAFGCYLARLTKSGIKGIFLEDQSADRDNLSTGNEEQPYVEYELNEASTLLKEKQKSIEQQIQYFKSYFDNHGIINHVHENKDMTLQEIIRETRFSDMVVIDAEAGFDASINEVPGAVAKKVLAESECPVIIAPLTFEGIDEIIFAYNGGQACMFAIKQLADLLPDLHELRITVLEVVEPGREPALYSNSFKEWMETRFSNINYVLLPGPTDNAMLGYLIEKNKSLIVMGAYGRNTVSNFFRHSSADVVLKTTSQPLFITHH